VLARATSAWLLVRLLDKRPVRPPDSLAALAAGFPSRLIDDRFDGLAAPSLAPGGASFRVGRFDLDPNGHANNVAVVRWLLESLPPGHGPVRLPLRTRIELRAECLEGDLLEAQVEEQATATRHALVRAADRREVARAETIRPVDAG
jgi:acyl-ACP thioesterase